jgi:nucleoside phosphorylase
MEASAFFNICERLRHVKSLGVIKGISDHGNTNKKLDNKERYVPALCSTAKTIKEWVKHHFSIENATDHG